MVFNSFACALFLLIFWPTYWLVKTQRGRHALLIVGSLFFYGWWDWRFVPLMIAVSVVAWAGPLLRERALLAGRERLARNVLAGSIALPLLGLAFFKYTLFFASAVVAGAARCGITLALPEWHIPLPVGISFYCFHAISYVVDVAKGKSSLERSYARVLIYIAFFPQLVAGPIVRSTVFLPQLLTDRVFSATEFVEGLRKMLSGLLVKVVFSDALAHWATPVFAHSENFTLAGRWLGALAFYGQIYFDFAGYSLIAIGVAQTLGYSLPPNFNVPYVARSVTEFWRRWHISLSTWLRDYLFIPLGGNRTNYVRNLMITMVLGGLWHGASWNFLLWGTLHGLALCLHKAWSVRCGEAVQRWTSAARWRGYATGAMAWALTQGFVLLCWVPFRSPTWANTMQFFTTAASPAAKAFPACTITWHWLVLPLLVDAWLLSRPRADTVPAKGLPSCAAGAAYGLLFLLVLALGTWDSSSFIYFQF